MKQYTIKISKWQLRYLDAASQSAKSITTDPGRDIRYVLPKKLPDNDSPKFDIEVWADSDTTLFDFGFWMERHRDQEQIKHYDLKDQVSVTVDIPGAFVGLCQAIEATPEKVLSLFAGDLSKHPFITGGSDERIAAEDYFDRHYIYGSDEKCQEKIELIFERLETLRHRWKGNDHMDEFKALYTKEIQKIFISQKKPIQ